MKAFKLR